MAQIQIDEAEHKRLTDTAALVAEAQQKAEDAEARAIAAEAAVAKAHADADQAAVDAAIAGHDFTALEADGLRSRATRGEDGRVDLDGFRKTVAEAAAEKATVAGFGRPTGLGAVHESTDYTEADLRRDQHQPPRAGLDRRHQPGRVLARGAAHRRNYYACLPWLR